jgi:putative membrane protein
MFGCGRFPTMIIIAVVGVVVFVILALAFGGTPYYGYGGYYGGMMGGLGGFGMFLWVPIVLVVVAVLGYVLWRGGGDWGMGGGGDCCGSGHQTHYASYGGRADAVEILRQRYSRGEITREQYEQMRIDIDRQ